MDLTKELTELKENVTPLNTAKFIFGTIVSCGAMAAVVALLRGSIVNSKGLTKLMMKIGIFALGCKAGDVAEKYFNETVDSVMEKFTEAKEEIKNESDSDK